MREHEIAPPPGARKEKRRVGRGDGSGMGSYSGRGVKGQKSRTGPGPHRGFEGGQLPLVKRLPHRRGFVNIFKVHYTEVKLERLNAFEDGSEVTPQALFERGIIRELDNPVKVLGNGELSKKLTVVAHKFSQSAKAKVEAAGGSVKEL